MGLLTLDTMQNAGGSKRNSLRQRLSQLLRGAATPKTRTLQHLEILPLGPKRSLHLVECEGERFLVAAGDGVSAPVPLTQRFLMRQAEPPQERSE